MSYCTWGFEAKGSVPKSSGPTHSPRNYQSSAIATIPAGTGATASPALTALHLPETNQNHLFAVRLIWALPLPSLIFWIPVFLWQNTFCPNSLTASSTGNKGSRLKGHIILDQRQHLPWFAPVWCCSVTVWEGAGKNTAGLWQGNQQQTPMLQKSKCSKIPSNHQEHADYSWNIFTIPFKTI